MSQFYPQQEQRQEKQQQQRQQQQQQQQLAEKRNFLLPCWLGDRLPQAIFPHNEK